jgi:hypothetical protein
MNQKVLIAIITSLLVSTFGLAIKDTSFREPFAKIACGSIAALVQISKILHLLIRLMIKKEEN